MKRSILTIIIAISWLLLSAGKWQTFTNTNHVYDLMVLDDGVYFSSWGGVMQIAPPAGGSMASPLSSMVQSNIWTTADGLSSNDVRNIEYINLSQSLWLGSAYDGISIINPLGVQQLNTELGLPSNHISKIVEHGSEILVGTENGLASYYYLGGVNFPLMLHQYTVQNTSGGLLSNAIDAMALAANDYLFLSSTAGINFVHLDSLAVDTAWHHFAGSWTGLDIKLSITADKLIESGGTGVGIHSTDPWAGEWTFYNNTNGVLHSAVSSASLDELNTLWVSYGAWDEDFLSYSRDVDTLFTSISATGVVKHWGVFEAGLGDKSVSKIVSHDGEIYLCTWGDGIYRKEGDVWVQFQPNSIGFPKIRNIVTDANNAAWFSSGNLNHLPLKKSCMGACKYLDGVWNTYNIANSPIHTDNIMTVMVDSRNRKWFGTYTVSEGESPEGWRFGVSVWDDTNNIWKLFDRGGIRVWDQDIQDWGATIPGSPTMLGNTDVYISQDQHGNMFVSCFDDGYTVFDPNDIKIAEFLIPNSTHQRSIYSFHNGSQYFFGTFNDNGLVIWDDDSIPVTNGDHWVTPEPSELSNCEVYGVVTVQSPYEGRQHWIAASNGLFMWDETDWYKWDTAVKRYIYNSNTGLWDNDLLYYQDEERLYGSVRTTPTAIYLDPFNRVWIGSLEHGLSMYDPQTERFTNYFKDNSPLLSDYITALGYQPVDGLLLIGTPEGLNTLAIGRTIKPYSTMGTLKLYPNPFHPDTDNSVKISNFPSEIMPAGTNQCRIYDSSGALVIVLEENAFSRFEWDGNNAKGKKCASGVYFVVVNDEKGNRRTGKIALLR